MAGLIFQNSLLHEIIMKHCKKCQKNYLKPNCITLKRDSAIYYVCKILNVIEMIQ